MNSKLFRQKAMESMNSPERVNEYVRVAGPSLYVILIALSICIIALLVLCVKGTITDSIRVEGVVFTHSGLKSVYVPDKGVITEMRVRRGREVYKGEELFRYMQDGIVSSVTSPADGVVLSGKHVNETFEPYEACIFIYPKESADNNREVIAYATYEELRKLRIGMAVQVSPVDLPREEYGYIFGRIVGIDNYPSNKESTAERFKVSELLDRIFPEDLAYEIKILLDTNESGDDLEWSHKHNTPIEISVGTICNIEVVTGVRPIYQLIFGTSKK